ncbi:MAG: metallophosphoesterase family protein [Desulfurococcaceae archaeon]
MGLENLLSEVSSIAGRKKDLEELVRDFQLANSKDYDCLRYVHHQVIEVKRGERDLLVIGDIHGDISTLYAVFKRESVIEHLKNDELIVVFLGDYIDRGRRQLLALTLAYYLKVHYPSSVVTLRGNHEPHPYLIPYPHDFPYELKSSFGLKWREIYELFLRSFQKLPLIAISPLELALLHGGIPRTVLHVDNVFDALGLSLPQVDDLAVEDILWSDPIEGISNYIDSIRGAGIMFGEELTKKFIEVTGVKAIIRSHEVVDGYRINHAGKVLTIFSAKETYGLRKASYVKLSKGFEYRKLSDYVFFA